MASLENQRICGKNKNYIAYSLSYSASPLVKFQVFFFKNELCFLLFVQSLKSKLSEANNGSLNLI